MRDRAEAVRRVRNRFRQRLRERFGPGGAEEELDFHSPQHSEGVAAAARKFLEVVRGVDPDLVAALDLDLVEIEGLAHDTVQKATLLPGRQRLRHRGYTKSDVPESVRRRGVVVGNERASAEELLDELGRYVLADGAPAFPVDDPHFRREVCDDIGATFPEVNPRAELGGEVGMKVSQPHLTPRSSLRALALANADLRGDLGCSPDFRRTMRHGDAEFRELRFGWKKEIARGLDALPRARRAKMAQEILLWVRNQVVFAKWQRALFLESLETNQHVAASPKAARIRAALRKHHSCFDGNIAALRRRAADLHERFDDPSCGEPEKLRTLLREIGYRV